MANRFLSDPDPTTAWARAAVDGKLFTVGELARHAAERHLRDMRDGERRGIYWRPEEAAHAINFLPSVFQVTDGPSEGKPFYPLEWHTFAIGSLFGWRNAVNRWRFRSGWLESGKGQAKSPLMGAIGIYIMGWCDIARAQCYAIGEDKATANVLFRDAVAMCRAPIPGAEEGESLDNLGEVVIRGELQNAWKIEHPDSGSFFQPIASGEAQSGPRPSYVAGDEIHEFKSDASLETWKRAVDKVAGNALMLLGTNTPGTSQKVGTSYSEMYQAIAKGEARDDSAFSLIFRVDKADRENVFENEGCWQKSLPAIGETFPWDNIRETVASAQTFAFRDTFTETSAIALSTHISNSGHTWAKVGAFDMTISPGNNRVRWDRGTGYERSSYAPSSPNYDVKVMVRCVKLRASGIALRMAADGGCVTVGYSANGASWSCNDRTSGNSLTGYTGGSAVTIELLRWYEMVVKVRGTTFEQWIDGVQVSPTHTFRTNYGANVGLANITSYSSDPTQGWEYGEMTVTEYAA